jgi:predicted GTPase
LAGKKQILVANKMDLAEAKVCLKKFKKQFRRKIFEISALNAVGLEALLEEITKNLEKDSR